MNTWVGSTIVVLCVCSESQLSVERSFQSLGFLVELTTLPPHCSVLDSAAGLPSEVPLNY